MAEEILKNQEALKDLEAKMKQKKEELKGFTDKELQLGTWLLSVSANFIVNLRPAMRHTVTLFETLERVARSPAVVRTIAAYTEPGRFLDLKAVAIEKELTPAIVLAALEMWKACWDENEREKCQVRERDRVERVFCGLKGELERARQAGAQTMGSDDEIELSPQKIKEYTDRYVVGQERAKKLLATVVYEYKRGIRSRSTKGNTVILLTGPTGCGKNFLLETIASCPGVGLPVYFYDLSAITPAGYEGDSASQIFKGFADYCRKKGVAPRKGIIVLDEADKKMSPSVAKDGTDFNRDAMSQLLTALAGDGEIEGVRCSDMLFVLSGAFTELREQKEKEGRRRGIGFGELQEDAEEQKDILTREDMIRGGMMREIAGRISLVIQVEKLTKKEMKEILSGPQDNSLVKEYGEIFAQYGTQLDFEEEAVELLAEMAYEDDLGARALRNAMTELLLPVRYVLAEKKAKRCVIRKETILRGDMVRWEYEAQGNEERITK